MRSAKRPKSHKKSSRHERISRKRYKNISSRSWRWNDDLSGLFIDDINEAIRARKSRRANGKGSWKLVPKDSCEVYKDRKRRSATHKRSELSSNDPERCNEEDTTDSKKKLRKKYTKKMIHGKMLHSNTRRKKRLGCCTLSCWHIRFASIMSNNLAEPKHIIHISGFNLTRADRQTSLNIVDILALAYFPHCRLFDFATCLC